MNSRLPWLVLVCGTLAFATVDEALAVESQGQEEQPAAVLLCNELTGFRIDIDFVDTEIRDVLRFFAQTTGLNIVIGPEVQGEVTVTLADVPWDAAFVAVLNSHGLGFAAERNVVRITTMARFIAAAEARARLAQAERQASPLQTVTLTLSYAQAADMVPIIESQLTERGSVIADQRTNSLIVRDTERAIHAIRLLIKGRM